MMLWGYLCEVLDYITGKNSVSEDFRELLRHYGLTRKDGDVIRKNLFAYDLVIPRDDDENVVYEIWAIEEFKSLFVNYFKRRYPSREMDSDYLNHYKVTDEYFRQKEEVMKVNAILEDYMGKDKLSNRYLMDLAEYNLLSSYFEITVKFFSTPLSVYENICDIRGYVLEYLKGISRKDELDGESPQTIDEAIEFLITNSNRDFIDFIHDHDEFYKGDDDSWNIVNFISSYFNFENRPDLMMECYSSKYNDLKYSYRIWDYDYNADDLIIYLGDDERDKKAKAISLEYEDFPDYKFGALSSSRFDAIIILNELRERIRKDYEDIIKTDFKDRLVQTADSCYIPDEIDDYSLNFLEKLFLKDEYDDLISYYSISKEEGEKIRDACYVFCFEYQDYESELIRDYQIARRFYSAFRRCYGFLWGDDKKPLDRFFEYSLYKKLDELTKDYQMRKYFEINLKDGELWEFLRDELAERDLLDYWDCIELYENGNSLDSKQKIRQYLDEFEDSYDFSRPQSIMESNRYLAENTSREFIDKIHDCEQDYVSDLHFTLGMWIRNEFGLNDRSNTKLIHNILESKYHIISFGSDNDSDVILREFHDYVRENYDEIIESTEFKNTIDMGKYILG